MSVFFEMFLPVRFGTEGSEAGEEHHQLCSRLIVLLLQGSVELQGRQWRQGHQGGSRGQALVGAG